MAQKLYKTYSYKIPIFYVTIKIMVAEKMEHMIYDKIFDLDEDKDSYPKTAAALCLTYKDDVYLCLPIEGKYATEFMFHEIIHAKNFVYSKRGVKLDVDNDENEAYLVQYIYSKCEDAKKKFAKFVTKQRDNADTTQPSISSSGPRSEVKEEDFNSDGGHRTTLSN